MPEIESPSRRTAPVAATTAAIMAAVVALHAALIPGGRWDGDEYFNFSLLRDIGWRFAWQRLYQWSPRPVSEAVLWLYDGAATVAGGPLITPFLGLIWAVLVGASVLALWRPQAVGASWRLAASLAVMAMLLLGHPVNEMFYWPMAAAPYLLAMAGVVVVTFRLVAGCVATGRDKAICAVALVVAAGSAEIGLFFVLGFAAMLALAELRGRLRGRLWYLLPLLLAAALLATWLSFRVADASTGLAADSIYFHHFSASLRAAVAALPEEFAGPDPLRRGPGPAWAVAAYALFFAGMLGSLRAGFPRAVPGRHLVALAAGLVASAFGSMAGAFYQFGLLCCERHHTFRQGLLILLLVVLARLAGQMRVPAAGFAARLAGPVLLLAAAAIPLSTRLPAILHDMRLLPADIGATEQNWASLRDPAAPLVFHLPVHGAVLEGLLWAPGHYTRDGGGPWFVSAMLRYFGRLDGNVVATPPPER